MVKQAGAIPVIVAATEEADFKITAEQLDAAITDKTKVDVYKRQGTSRA